jgi:hypothetical protein
MGMRWSFRMLLCLVVAVMAMAGPANLASGQDKKDRPIQGTIAKADKVDLEGKMGTRVLRICLVEGIKDGLPERDKSDKASLQVTNKTKIMKVVGKERKPATLEDLVKGSRIEFEYSKDIGLIETFPVTIYATMVVIQEPQK